MSQETACQNTADQETTRKGRKGKDAIWRESWPQKEIVLRFVMKLASVLLILWLIFSFVFALHQVNGESMYPRVRDGDLILSFRLERDYEIGDVVSFQINGYDRVARIVAQGGDVVDLSTDGKLIVNGNVEEEDEIFYQTESEGMEITYPYTVDEDSYFLLCDFRTGSSDSRTYGAFSQDVIEGKVISVFRHRGI